MTNAQVNVVMSDKALVKHLQREVARLESELRVPHSYSKLESLLREKEAQIQKVALVDLILASILFLFFFFFIFLFADRLWAIWQVALLPL